MEILDFKRDKKKVALLSIERKNLVKEIKYVYVTFRNTMTTELMLGKALKEHFIIRCINSFRKR